MIVLDSSAVLAVLLGERGADNVVARFPEAVISAASLAEILSKVERKGISSEAAYGHVVSFGIGIHPVEVIHARIAGRIALAPRELDLSLGDRLCIALAITLDAELITSDGRMARFEAGIPITLFR